MGDGEKGEYECRHVSTSDKVSSIYKVEVPFQDKPKPVQCTTHTVYMCLYYHGALHGYGSDEYDY